MTEPSKTDPSELARRAEAIKKQAELETDSATRERLGQMADHYSRLAESQSWSASHPVSIASITEIFDKKND